MSKAAGKLWVDFGKDVIWSNNFNQKGKNLYIMLKQASYKILSLRDNRMLH